MDSALNMLGMCKKAGALETGEEPCGAVVRSGKAVLLMTASDAGHGAQKRAENYSEWCGAPLITLPYDKDVLGDMLGKRVCAVMAITDGGLAASFMKKLSAAHEGYSEAAAAVTEKAEKQKARARAAANGRKGRKVHD
ncbi:MAG: 50S ribosomal protein L7 [Oscillospiraceae bacterium]|jgi:ribosomal protein L7Ae-like RNA K-turn-binding protein|nr:50S ribosomal protein L7 [Oscillospiraceae bacterium]